MAKVQKEICRQPYAYDADDLSAKNGLFCADKSMTQQSMSEDADINVIVRRFGLDGRLPENVRVPTYGDFAGISDYRDAIHVVKQAEESFMAMPARVRARFENDPQMFLEFCSDPKNLAEMRELGLAVPEPKVDTPPAGGAPAAAVAAPGAA